MNRLARIPYVLFVCFFSATALVCLAAGENPALSLVTDPAPGVCVRYGLDELTRAIEARGIRVEKVGSIDDARGQTVIIAGLSHGDGAASLALKAAGGQMPTVPESLTIRQIDRGQRPVWVIGGFDDRGLMYGLLDTADRIGWGKEGASLMDAVREITEKPDVKERAVSIFTMNRAYWESRFYDETYWARYLDMLARNRFNSLVVIFGYENGGFLAPCYPYFFNVEDYPGIRMRGLTGEQQRRNLAALNRLIEMAHERGVQFSVGIWDHIYRGGVQSGSVPGAAADSTEAIEGLVYGLDGDTLIPYTQAALASFVKLVPDLDGIQFRMHDESGLKKSEQEHFWEEVFRSIKAKSPHMNFVLRAKGLPDAVIESALDTGVHFSIGTKYWMEQMGMPYHPTHINRQNQFDRRHGYADMLRYPKRYDMYWRLWNGGTTRILLWGDPDYARRFVESTHLYDGRGFEVNEPLATKMHGQPHQGTPVNDLLKPARRYYDYEFERYWHFFQVFGRLGYNPKTPSDVWDGEFQRRFGPDAGPIVEQALHRASWVLPRIVASVYHYDSSFPMTRGWAEKQRLGDLPLYAEGEGSDIQQFVGFDEEAQRLLDGGRTAKITPSANSRWFERISADLDRLIADAQRADGGSGNKEFQSTVTDLKILSGLALYHSRRIPAAVSYCLFKRTGDPSVLDDAIAYERSAIDAWRGIVAAADDVYADDLMMGVTAVERKNKVSNWIKRLSGHWRDELVLLEKGLADLEAQRRGVDTENTQKTAAHYQAMSDADYDVRFEFAHRPVHRLDAGKPLVVSVTAGAPSGIDRVTLRFRSVNQEKDYQSLPMQPTDEKDVYRAVVPADQIDPQWDFMYFIEVMDNAGHGRIFPDLNTETPYIVVRLIR